MIKIICLGKIKENYLNDLINDYVRRIGKYHKIQIIELKDNEDIVVETKEILKNINERDFNIAMTIDGNKLNSLKLASKIEKTFMNYGTITFIIGSSNGLSEEVVRKCNYELSFSSFTFPHGLFRGILLEQIYRSFKINNNETYHK